MFRRRKHNEYNTSELGKSIFYTKQNLCGDYRNYFNIKLIPLLNKVFCTNNLHLLTIEQQQFLEHYFLVADPYSAAEITVADEVILSDVMKEFDSFLGSSTGE
jgi:hypothetical protein